MAHTMCSLRQRQRQSNHSPCDYQTRHDSPTFSLFSSLIQPLINHSSPFFPFSFEKYWWVVHRSKGEFKPKEILIHSSCWHFVEHFVGNTFVYVLYLCLRGVLPSIMVLWAIRGGVCASHMAQLSEDTCLGLSLGLSRWILDNADLVL